MILLTGGSGLLGTELRKRIDCLSPSHAEFDITDPELRLPPGVDCIVHCAAYTDVRGAERERAKCWDVNVTGTRRIAGLGVPVIYLSTEYVFDGRNGNYREDDPLGPVNFYSFTKAMGEMAVRTAPRSLVIRCVFKPYPFEHSAGFVDQWTSGDYVDVIAERIAMVIKHRDRFEQHDTIHVGASRKAVYTLACETRAVRRAYRDEAGVTLPRDTSLDTARYDSLFGAIKIDIDFAKPLFGDDERSAVNRVLAGHWLAAGDENAAFEREFAEYLDVPYALAVNSGSSANLLALAALDLPPKSRVLTSGCGFPATLSPILHLGHQPVLVDYDAAAMNVDVTQVVTAIRHRRCDAVVLAHTLGAPVHLRPILDAAQSAGIPVIEDCCEAAGAVYQGSRVGSLGAAGTFSFYPSHQITAAGGGGMVVFKDDAHYRRAKSLRDWGKRSDWDSYGRNNTSYSVEVDGLDYFPHYSYETVGWNFRLPEVNCAFGRVQLQRLDGFVRQRQQRHDWLAEGLTTTRVPDDCEPSWFGFPVLLPADAPIGARDRLGDYLEQRGVRHRPFFAGNITRHAPFASLRQELPVADYLMTHALFVGCGPHMSRLDCQYVAEVVRDGLALVQRAEAA